LCPTLVDQNVAAVQVTVDRCDRYVNMVVGALASARIRIVPACDGGERIWR
jgi:hypothetical protein